MNLRNLQRDKVFIEKSDGSRTGPHKATVSQNTAIISDEQLDINEGEKLIRALPNGKEEVYLVLDSEFSPGLASIPAHFNLTLRKATAVQAPSMRHTTVNIHNSSGIQVGDHNVVNIQNALNELIQRIESSTASQQQKAEAKGRLTALLEHPLVSAVLGGVVSGIAS